MCALSLGCLGGSESGLSHLRNVSEYKQRKEMLLTIANTCGVAKHLLWKDKWQVVSLSKHPQLDHQTDKNNEARQIYVEPQRHLDTRVVSGVQWRPDSPQTNEELSCTMSSMWKQSLDRSHEESER